MNTDKENKYSLICGIAGILILAVLWQLLATIAAQPDVFPTATASSQSAVELLETGFTKDLTATVARSVSSWLISILVGLLAGLVIGSTRPVFWAMRPILIFLRCLPAFLLISIPLSFGYGGETARLLVIASAGVWIITDEAAASVRNISRDKNDVLKVMKASWWFRLKSIYFFEALSSALVPSARNSAAICFVVTIVVETLAIPSYGVGARVLTLLAISDAPRIFAFLMLTGLTGVISSWVLDTVARRLIYWI